MDVQFWVDKTILFVAAIGGGGALIKIVSNWVSRQRVKAESDSIVAQTYKDLIGQVMNQLEAVRAENRIQAREMSEIKIDHIREMSDERRSCAEQMGLLRDYFSKEIRELENKIYGKKE